MKKIKDLRAIKNTVDSIYYDQVRSRKKLSIENINMLRRIVGEKR